ncbi:histidine--tRNA ligase [Bifidobacterium vespertilionis]|uniref:Histidine--tRNA ligase n=1 Tax=Bifidobacterium vespertilionis TaxID=2562524 RepID=A0A5J5DV19_9BIFI|nr:histidine--tRNA ligase [Bifidobacterium vespertilionis]KAA8820070.1 histidine--tRNA ligase [Bifidobacterium vespertilionis]KAA8822225.1 histidine--tRNA ligase [Bifidobacterium vespertilionis]
MAKGASLSGFPEWLPSERVVEQRVIDTLRNVFELNGFVGIETRAVEQGSSLLKKGETSKEIYLLSRLQEVGQENDTPVEERLGLHFDLTVPLSRYVVEHSGDLAFPFKRWQIQKVWRGERPQEGRFREFVQADIDVVGNGELPEHYEVELPLVMVSALERLRAFGLPKATVHANNRKLSEGFYRGLGLTDIEGVLREIDKLDKIGADEVSKLLVEGCGASEAQAKACLELAELTAADGAELKEKFDALCAAHGIATDGSDESYALARQGLDTLAMIVDEAARIRPGSVIADLKIARGLDYYTGSVYETFLDGAASLGSICSGGRYDNLASQGNRKYPGVGLSIGLSRLVSYMLHTAGAHANRVSPAVVLVAVWNEDDRAASNRIANALRERGIAADVAPTAAKLGKQIKYADKLGIPYVWFPGQEGAGDEVKDIVSGDQSPADATSWEPDTVVARQTVVID